MAQVGRPSDYTPEIAARICSEISGGSGVRAICASEGMPDASTVFRWISAHPEFREQYIRARDSRADARFEQVDSVVEDMRTGVIDHNQARIQIDAIKWQAAHEAPKRYGDRVGIGLDPETAGASLEVVFTRAIDQARRAELPAGDDPEKGA